MKKDFVELKDGTKLSVAIDGALNKNVIMFVNGSIFNYRQFHFQLYPRLKKMLDQEWGFVFYDYIGIGNSSPLSNGYDFRSLIMQHNELLDELGLEKVHHFGYSKGAIISLMSGKRSHSIGCIGSPNLAYNDPEMRKQFKERAALLENIKDLWNERITEENFGRIYNEIFVPIIFKSRKLGFLDRVKSWYISRKGKEMLLGTPVQSLVKLYSTYAEGFGDDFVQLFLSSVKSLDIPVLLLHSREDTTTPIDGARQLAEMIPKAQLIEFDKMTHISPAIVGSQAQKVMTRYADFLKSIA